MPHVINIEKILRHKKYTCKQGAGNIKVDLAIA